MSRIISENMCQWEGGNNAPTLGDNSFDGMECTAHHYGYMVAW